jgi:hypothetical protein
VKTERDIDHSRAQRLAGAHGFIDDRDRRKDAGKEGVQGAAIVGMVRASIRMRTAVVMMAIRRVLMSLTRTGMRGAGMMMISHRDGGSGNRMRLCQRRRNDAGKLGGQKQRDQKPNRERLSAEPLHGGIVGRPTASVNPERFAL